MLQPLELKLGEGFTDDDNRTTYKERTESNNCQRSREVPPSTGLEKQTMIRSLLDRYGHKRT
jgi:hypothetical protein